MLISAGIAILLVIGVPFVVIGVSQWQASHDSKWSVYQHPLETQVRPPRLPPGAYASPAAASEPESRATPQPTPEAYVRKFEGLPDAAKAVLRFQPADSEDQLQSASVADRVELACGMTDYVGSSDFPGTIRVGGPGAHGWARVTWSIHGCQSLMGDLYKNPVLTFEISEDRNYPLCQ